jgi:ABC-type proline/glycine betaine transport system substrate-binding protein
MKKKERQKQFEELIIEKLSQLENGELDNCPPGKKLAEEISKKEWCLEIYKKYKNDNTRTNTKEL